VLDRMQYLAESGLTSLMVLHDFLSRRLAPLQDRATRPAWMFTGVNDIMRLERGPGSSLDGELVAACLKALTTDQFSARAREYPRGSFTTTMRYRLTRTNPCRCGYGRSSRLVGPAVLAPLRPSW
jgi:hypothetical protein